MNYDLYAGICIGFIAGIGIGFAVNPIMYFITKRKMEKQRNNPERMESKESTPSGTAFTTARRTF